MQKINRRSTEQLGRRLASKKTVRNVASRTNDSKKVIRNNYRNFSIKRELKTDSSRQVSQADGISTIDRKVSINNQIRLYRRLESDDGNRVEDREAVYLQYRMMR